MHLPKYRFDCLDLYSRVNSFLIDDYGERNQREGNLYPMASIRPCTADRNEHRAEYCIKHTAKYYGNIHHRFDLE
jgi:hypothetical protein